MTMNHTAHTPGITRRHLICSATALFGIALAGCSDQARPSFNGIDVSQDGASPDFKLTGPGNQTYSVASFQGKAVIMFFGYTQCPDVCPTALGRAAEVKRLLGPDADRLQVLFITLDPERDTPEMITAYTSAFDPSFIGLYGDAQHTAEAAKAFKVFYKKVPTGSSYALDHSSLTYALDPQGKLRLALRHDQTAADYAHDIRSLLHPA